jgi:hypothetical protein
VSLHLDVACARYPAGTPVELYSITTVTRHGDYLVLADTNGHAVKIPFAALIDTPAPTDAADLVALYDERHPAAGPSLIARATATLGQPPQPT